MMRKASAVLVLAAGMLLGYTLRPVPAVAQSEFQPFTVGQTVRLTVEGFPAGEMRITCNIVAVSNDFIHCGGDSQHRPRAVNLRYVQEIAPPLAR
jgi:hypothetical protein